MAQKNTVSQPDFKRKKKGDKGDRGNVKAQNQSSPGGNVKRPRAS